MISEKDQNLQPQGSFFFITQGQIDNFTIVIHVVYCYIETLSPFRVSINGQELPIISQFKNDSISDKIKKIY